MTWGFNLLTTPSGWVGVREPPPGLLICFASFVLRGGQSFLCSLLCSFVGRMVWFLFYSRAYWHSCLLLRSGEGEGSAFGNAEQMGRPRRFYYYYTGAKTEREAGDKVSQYVVSTVGGKGCGGQGGAA